MKMCTLLSFTQHNVSEIIPCHSRYQSFFVVADSYYMDLPQLIYLCINGHLGCYQIWANTNKAAMNSQYKPSHGLRLFSLGEISRDGRAG